MRRRTLTALRSLLLAVLLSLTFTTATAQASQTPHAPHRDPRASSSFVELRDIDPTIIEDIRYATPHNFTGVPVTGYTRPLCLLTRSTAQALHRAQRRLLRRGYSLKVYDCYRPQRAVDHLR
ncbi:D-Ala-D-Ala dipeptidase [Streptomyces sp. SPB074]|nr:D-Ala-D-Ala dipeptidase [Streptomyces sp. SPB074]